MFPSMKFQSLQLKYLTFKKQHFVKNRTNSNSNNNTDTTQNKNIKGVENIKQLFSKFKILINNKKLNYHSKNNNNSDELNQEILQQEQQQPQQYSSYKFQVKIKDNLNLWFNNNKKEQEKLELALYNTYNNYYNSENNMNYNYNNNVESFPIQNLPEELILRVTNFLTLELIARLSNTSNKFYRLMQDLSIWKEIVLEKWDIKNSHSILSQRLLNDSQWKNYCQLKTLYHKRNTISSFYLRCKGGMPSPRYQHTGTVIGNSSIYYIGGQETQIKRFNDIFRFDIEKNRFYKVDVQGPNYPPKFARHTSVAIKNKIFVFGGFDGSGVYFDMAIFDTDRSTWSLPVVTGTPPRSRTNHASAAVGKDLYIFGGINRNSDWELQDLDEFFVFDTSTMNWSQVAATGDIPSARCGHRMISIGKRLYLFGGGSGDNWLNKMNDFHIFDTESKVWRKTPSNPMVQVCTFSCVFVIGPLIYVFGGQHLIRGKVTKKLYIFDSISESWFKQSFSKTLFPSARDMATANVINNKVVIFGGYDGRAMDELNLLEFSPSLVNMLKCNY